MGVWRFHMTSTADVGVKKLEALLEPIPGVREISAGKIIEFQMIYGRSPANSAYVVYTATRYDTTRHDAMRHDATRYDKT